MVAGALAFGAQAQLVTDKEIKSGGYGEKKMKKAPKKVYINRFFVNYQVLSSSSEISNKAKTSMTVGLNGIEPEDMQQITDNAYKMVTDKLTAAGFELVGADEAAGIDKFEGWERLQGGTPSTAQVFGFVSTAPTGYDFFVKGIKKSGKNKKSIFDGTPAISKDLGDIPVFEANVNFQYVTIEGKTMINSATQLKGVVNYEMPPAAIGQSATGVFGSKVESVPTSARFVWKGGAPGAGAMSIVYLYPKKAVDIPGVVEKKKFKEYTSNSNYMGSFGAMLISDRKDVKVSHQVKADRAAYIEKTQQTLNEYLSMVVDAFIANANG